MKNPDSTQVPPWVTERYGLIATVTRRYWKASLRPRRLLTMKHLRLRTLLSLFVAALVLFFSAGGCGPTQRDLGNTVISKVEGYRREKGRLPVSLSEAGIEADESCPCYCKTGENSYVVWYRTMLGKSDTYDSQRKKWSEAQQAPF